MLLLYSKLVSASLTLLFILLSENDATQSDPEKEQPAGTINNQRPFIPGELEATAQVIVALAASPLAYICKIKLFRYNQCVRLVTEAYLIFPP